MEALKIDPDRDVTSIEVDLRLSTLKPRHAKVMTDLYHHLQSHKDHQGRMEGSRYKILDGTMRT